MLVLKKKSYVCCGGNFFIVPNHVIFGWAIGKITK